MPLIRCTSVQFLKKILEGDKNFFYQHQVPVINILRINNLNINLVLEKVYKIPLVRSYLPDFDKDIGKRMSRDFLFAIVNKLYHSFFQHAIDEIETR